MFVHLLSPNANLRLLETRNAEGFFCLVNSNHDRLRGWCPWLDRVETIEDTRDFIREKLLHFAKGNGFTAGIFDYGRLAGVTALEYIDTANRSTEIGYWVDSQSEGRGLVTSACRSVIAYSFTELGIERVQIRCATENQRSRAIPERLGFKLEGVLRHCERLSDRTVDLAVYGLLASEWRSPS